MAKNGAAGARAEQLRVEETTSDRRSDEDRRSPRSSGASVRGPDRRGALPSFETLDTPPDFPVVSPVVDLEARVQSLEAELEGAQAFGDSFVMEGARELSDRGIKGQVVRGAVCFFDLSGFTARTNRLTQEIGRAAGEKIAAEVDEVLGPIVNVVHRYRGVIDKYSGDAVMAVFEGHQDDPRLALEAALDVRETVHELQAQTGFEITVGVDFGVLYLGQMGGDGRYDYTVMGDPANFAAKFEKLCEPWDILVGSNVAERTGDYFEFEEVEVEVPKVGPVTAYKLLGRKEQEISKRDLTAYIIGRQEEYRTLASNLGEGRFLGVSGVAGVGKSQLVNFLAGSNAVEPFNLYEVAAEEVRSNTPYALWAKFLDRHFGSDSTRSRTLTPPGGTMASLPSMRTRLTQEQFATGLGDYGLTGDQAEFLGAIMGLEGADVSSYSSERVLDGVTDAMRTLLSGVERTRRPSLLSLQDLHWADEASLEVIRRLHGDVTAVLDYRPSEIVERMIDLDERVVLGTLGRENSELLVQNVLDDADVERGKIDGLLELADGLPIILETGALALLKGDEITGMEHDQMLISEVRRAGITSTRAMQAASLLGREIDTRVLRRVCDFPLDVRPLVERGLVQELEGHYRIDHQTRVEALVKTLGDKDAAALHLRAARAYESVYNGDAVIKVIHHLEQVEERLARQSLSDSVLLGATPKDRKKMLEAAYGKAAGQAYGVADYKGAVDAYEKSANLQDTMDGRLDGLSAAFNAALYYEDRGETLRLWGEVMHSIEGVGAGVMSEDGDFVRMNVGETSPDASVRSRYRTMASTGFSQALDGDYEGSVDCMREARELAKSVGDDAYVARMGFEIGRSLVMNALTTGKVNKSEISEAVGLYRAGREELGPYFRTHSTIGLAQSLMLTPGGMDEALEVLNSVREEDGFDPGDLLAGHLWNVFANYYILDGRPDVAERYVDMLEGVSEKYGVGSLSRYVKCNRAEIAAQRGDRETSERLFDEAIDDANASGDLYGYGQFFERRKEVNAKPLTRLKHWVNRKRK